MINEESVQRFNFDDYDVILKSLNVENNIDELPKSMTIGIKNIFLNKEKKDNDLIVPIGLDVLGCEGNKKSAEELEENVSFKINVVYIVKFKSIDINIDLEKQKKEIDKLAYFLALPTLKEMIASIGQKIGIPTLSIPTKINSIEKAFKDGNND